MIPITRGPEPAKLATKRAEQLKHLRTIKPPPVSDDIIGYRIIAEELWKSQRFKCCYCEAHIRLSYNAVEHFRPKGAANRSPGSLERHGYWWLAFHWDNLLFCCPDCNSSAKKDQFPLAHGSTALQAEENPPGNEIAMLLDPTSGINPAEHIEYVHTVQGKRQTRHWYARSRNGLEPGNQTIKVCGLNQQALLQSRDIHIQCHVQKVMDGLDAALASRKKKDILREFQRASALFLPNMPYALLTYDALRAHFPDATLLATIKQTWPTPAEIGK